jgi:hypothetical protein
MENDDGYFSLLEAFKGSIELDTGNIVTGMLPMGTMCSYENFKTAGEVNTNQIAFTSTLMGYNSNFNNNMFGNFYSDFTYIYNM